MANLKQHNFGSSRDIQIQLTVLYSVRVLVPAL